MATKITSVYVKNRAVGETSFTEVDSVYAGSTRVFEKSKSSPATTPMGIIPLAAIPNASEGQFGPYRTLFTQEQMQATSAYYGFLLTPVQYKGGLYFPNVTYRNDIGYLTVYFNYYVGGGHTSTKNYSIMSSGGIKLDGFGEYNTFMRDIPAEGDTVFSPTLTNTLYRMSYTNYDSTLKQPAYLCNLSSLNKGSLPYPVVWMEVLYKWVAGVNTNTPRIQVCTKPISGKIVSERNSTAGIKYVGTSNLYVN